ncbi:MAG TPA: 7-carboxy-7-deazaguanine synthase [Rhizomicrobium sp.]|jgi:7-carboxy-7-deazaguanine synthase (Cx14CxxC type)|nr:7-carboxy-7-deazaguanine synthase [Rhizomicrobium sp.]
MSYQVKEIYCTLQGEGARAGRAAVFLRFAGCNLWSGRERDRAQAVCKFCDTDFVGTDGPSGGSFRDAAALADAVAKEWPHAHSSKPYVVCTGGEPLLQLDEPLIVALHARAFEIGIETNGTMLPPVGIDWICVSPKADADLKLMRGNELKLVYPQEGAPPERYAGLQFDHFFLQPMDSPTREANTRAAIKYCLSHPQWRLSLQTHKLIGIR